MFKKYFNKRAVSPVIAVVLLIALTVAAAAIIWAISTDLLSPQVTMTVQTTDATTSTGLWKGTVTVSTPGSITGVSMLLTNGTTITTTYTNLLVKGDNSVTLDFQGTILAGTHSLTLTFVPTGESIQKTATVDVTFA